LELSTVRKVIITNHGIKINEFTLLKFEWCAIESIK
jgi:hypothetical protein